MMNNANAQTMKNRAITTRFVLTFCFLHVTMMLLHSQGISYFNVKRTIWLKGYQNGNYIQ